MTRLAHVIARLIAAVAVLLFAGASIAYPDRTSWLPMSLAPYWTFESDGATNTIQLVDEPNGRKRLSSFLNQDVRILQRGENVYLRYRNRVSPLFLFKRGVNAAWKVRLGRGLCERYNAQWVSTNATVLTTMGVFPNCRVLSLTVETEGCGGVSTGSGFNFETMNVYFAQGYGPVQITTDETTWNPARREFVAPSLDPAVSLNIAGNAFTNFSYSGSCVQCAFPAPMTFTVTLSNKFSHPICVDGQIDVDVNIVDRQGRLMNSWPFKPDIFIPDPQLLQPGETLSWNGMIPLIDRTGTLLVDEFQVWARVFMGFRAADALDCYAPTTGWEILGAKQPISVVIRYGYTGGVIIGL